MSALAREAVRWAAPDLAPAPVPLSQGLPNVEDLQAIAQAAHAEGFAQGHVEGLASGQAEARRIVAQMEGILDAFTRPLARLDAEVGDALGDLAVRIAGALLGRTYSTDPSLLIDLVREALDIAGSDNRQIELRLHPDDLGLLAPHLMTLEGVRLAADTTLARGDLRLHADSVRIDGSLSARLSAALQKIVAGETR